MTDAVVVESPLARLLDSIELNIVDIGARGKPLSFMKSLMPFARYVACEPDIEEAERLAQDLAADGRWLRTTVFSEAIASRPGEAQLMVTRHPGMSSLLEPDATVVNRYCKAGAFQVVNSSTVATVTLDVAAKRHGFEEAGFLKIDTQGTELDILRSGERLVSGSVVGVYLEALFQPFYRGQSLFSDLDTHLRGRGFSLFDLARTHLRRAAGASSYYSRRPIVWAHCLFLKEPSALEHLDGRAHARAPTARCPRHRVRALRFRARDTER
jgi:FkbM family methyltransferase